MTSQRVAVFIDYQNVYRGARSMFDLNGKHYTRGQIRPLSVGLLVRGPKDSNRELVSINCYRGLPSYEHNPRGFNAAQRQISSWVSRGGGLVRAYTRPINYRDPSRPQEKGVDVAIAVDFVLGFQQGLFDVGVIFSDDTDLYPALEAVERMGGPGHVEVASWHNPDRHIRPVQLTSSTAPLRVLGHKEFLHAEDQTDYMQHTGTKLHSMPHIQPSQPPTALLEAG